MTTLTNDQQLTWDVLSNNAERLSHIWAKELTTVKRKQINNLANERIKFMLTNFSNEQIARTIKTWLHTYQIPLDPNEISSFDDFHNQVGQYIAENLRIITPYENTIL